MAMGWSKLGVSRCGWNRLHAYRFHHIRAFQVERCRPTGIFSGECKRVDRKFSRWGFVHSPLGEQEVVFDRFIFRPPNDLRAEPVVGYPGPGGRPYHLGLAIKKGEETGDSAQQGKNAINDATAQVLRGVGGLINHVFGPRDGERPVQDYAFLPVIFTTAELWVTEKDISSAQLTTGDVQNVESEKKDWIWFNHNRSPRLRHGLKSAGSKADNLADALRVEFTRSVAIVSVEGIDSFLSQDFGWVFQ